MGYDLIIIIVLGFIAYLVETYIPMQKQIQQLFRFVIIMLIIAYVLALFGVSTIPLAHFRIT